MYEDCGISIVLWKDKKPILLISTHTMPVGYPCEPVSLHLRGMELFEKRLSLHRFTMS